MNSPDSHGVAQLFQVTIGNTIGGGGLVGAVYWFIYLRKRQGRKIT